MSQSETILKNLDITHHWVADEVYSKRTVIEAGVVLTQHTHKFDHASALVKGSALVEVDGEATIVNAPAMLLIQAGKEHRVTARTEVVWHCLWITSEADPDKIDAEVIA